MNGISAAGPNLAGLRAQVFDILLGTVFLSIGLTACAMAAIRWRRGVRILLWWGIWSGMYGLQTLVHTPAISDQREPHQAGRLCATVGNGF